jgi:uncharacterized protein (DUF305 family)
MKKNFFLVTAIAVSVALLQACNGGNSSTETKTDTTMQTDGGMKNMGPSGDAEHDNMMKKMMDEMGAMKMSGDFDLDFANMMIPHHQSAVDMAQMYLPKGKDEKIKMMAQNIISAQKKEIEELKTMVANHEAAEKKEQHSAKEHGGEKHNELMETMNTMMSKMKDMKMTGDADKDFVMMMIPHHQSSVDMADDELSHGKHVEIKQFAQKVVDGQSKEIKEFNEWLATKK